MQRATFMMLDHRQKSLVAFVAVLAVVLAVVHHAEAQCDATTCVGPVIVSFTVPDCVAANSTGFYELIGDGRTSKCDALGADDYTQYQGTFCKDGYIVDGYFLDSTCSSDIIYSYAYQAGKCFSNPSGTSWTRLCSVNDTWSLLEKPNPNNFPHYTNEEIPCDSPNNCSNMAYYKTSYASTTCNPINATSSYGYVNNANFSFGACFYNPLSESVYTTTCGAENLETVEYQNGDAGCTGQPAFIALTGRSCRPNDYEKRDSQEIYPYHQLFCPYIPPPSSSPPTPTGSSNMLSINAALMGLCVLFFAFVLF
jgi:hypothetical protein